MKTKIGLPFGLALVVFIGVFTTMLALGALNPQRADAQTPTPLSSTAADFDVVLSHTEVGAYADWTITGKTGAVLIPVGNAMAFTVTGFNLDTCTATENTVPCDEGNWEITVPEVDDIVVDEVTVTTQTISVTFDKAIPATTTFTLKYYAVKDNAGKLVGGIQNPSAAGPQTITVDTVDPDVVVGIRILPMSIGIIAAGLDVERPKYQPEAYSDWTITAKRDDTTPGADDVIVIKFAGHDVGATCEADDSDHAVCTASNWRVAVSDDPETDGVDAVEAAIPQSVTVIKESQTVLIQPASPVIPADTTIIITFTAPASDEGIKNPAPGMYDIMVGMYTFEVTTSETAPPPRPLASVALTTSSKEPGYAIAIGLEFVTTAELRAGLDKIRVRFDKDIGAPASLDRSDVQVYFDDGVITTERDKQTRNLEKSPVRSLVTSQGDGSAVGDRNIVQYTLTVPDMDPASDTPTLNIPSGATVTVTFDGGAGFTNPTEHGRGDKISVALGDQPVFAVANVYSRLSLSVDDVKDKRNTPLTVIGKGFKNGTTVDVWIERSSTGGMPVSTVDVPVADDTNRIGMIDDNETVLSSLLVGSDDTFETTFSVKVPPFMSGGKNYINAKDGEEPDPNTFMDMMMLPTFTVDKGLTASPPTANVGDTVRLELRDYPVNSIRIPTGGDTAPIKISGVGHFPTGAVTIDENGDASFNIVVENNVPVGKHELRLEIGGENAETTITIGGATLTARPASVVPNQSITIQGRGFGKRATINARVDDTNDSSMVSISGNSNGLKSKGGDTSPNINSGEAVTTDDSGNWTATIVLPVNTTTTSPGTYTLKVEDSAGRTGEVELIIAARTLTLEPAVSRPGTTITVTGAGFPARSTDSQTLVTIKYDDKTRWSLVPDASGNFAASFRVPGDALTPSTNTVSAEFMASGTSAPVVTTVVHNVPAGTITLDRTEARPGDTVEVTGTGFKNFASLQLLMVGNADVTPSPRPTTGGVGEFTASFLVPDLDDGTHTVRVDVGNTTSSESLRISRTAEAPTTMMMEAEATTPEVAFAAVIAEDNLVKVFHFDAATQNEAPNYGWTIYDARPLFMKTNTLSTITPGGFYFLQVKNDQMGVEIGGRTIDLYAGLNPVQW